MVVHSQQRYLLQVSPSPSVASSVSTEILHVSEKDVVVSNNAITSEERALFPEHNGGNPIFLARLILILGQFLTEQ